MENSQSHECGKYGYSKLVIRGVNWREWWSSTNYICIEDGEFHIQQLKTQKTGGQKINLLLQSRQRLYFIDKCLSFEFRAFQFEWHLKWVIIRLKGLHFIDVFSNPVFNYLISRWSEKDNQTNIKIKSYLLFFCLISFLFLILFLLPVDHFFSSFLCAPSCRPSLWNWTGVHSLWSFAPRVSSDRQTWFIVAVRTMRPHSRVMLQTDSFQSNTVKQ